MSNINAILHHADIVSDLKTSLIFYCDALGLTQNFDRPDLGYPGAWLDVGSQQIHLMELPNPDPVAGRPDHGGRDRHVALAVNDFEKLKQMLNLPPLPSAADYNEHMRQSALNVLKTTLV